MAKIIEKIEEKKEVVKKSQTEKKKNSIVKDASLAWSVLIEPWITEKTHSAMANNKYTFKVTKIATKKQVKKSIEALYSVEVEKIAITNIHSKKRNYGRYTGTKSAIKKAIITIKNGQSIEIFKGA